MADKKPRVGLSEDFLKELANRSKDLFPGPPNQPTFPPFVEKALDRRDLYVPAEDVMRMLAAVVAMCGGTVRISRRVLHDLAFARIDSVLNITTDYATDTVLLTTSGAAARQAEARQRTIGNPFKAGPVPEQTEPPEPEPEPEPEPKKVTRVRRQSNAARELKERRCSG